MENIDKYMSYAKAGVFADITDNKSAQEIYDNFIENTKTLELSAKQVISAIYQPLYNLKKPKEIFDIFIEKHPEEAELIVRLKINLYVSLRTNGDEIYQMIKNANETYGETKEGLLTEVDFLVSDNFRDPKRIKYIFAKVKAMEDAENAAI